MANLIIFFLLFKISLLCSLPRSNAVYINVLDYGAKADGKTDSAEPLLRAWAAACRSSSPAATIHVPAGSFLVSQATFNGPCKNAAIKFSIDGTIVSPPYYGGKPSASMDWIVFNDVQGVTIRGGNLDGRGGALWTCKFDGRSCPTGATVSKISVAYF